MQVTIEAEIEHTLGNRSEFIDKTYCPFKMEVPKLSKQDMYKFLMYTLLKNNFTVLSTETIAEIGAKITTHDEQFFKEHKVGAPKLNTLFWTSKSKLNKGAKIHACWILFGITAKKKRIPDYKNLQPIFL